MPVLLLSKLQVWSVYKLCRVVITTVVCLVHIAVISWVPGLNTFATTRSARLSLFGSYRLMPETATRSCHKGVLCALLLALLSCRQLASLGRDCHMH